MFMLGSTKNFLENVFCGKNSHILFRERQPSIFFFSRSLYFREITQPGILLASYYRPPSFYQDTKSPLESEKRKIVQKLCF